MSDKRIKNGETVGFGVFMKGPETNPPRDPKLEDAMKTIAKFMMLNPSTLSQDELLTHFILLLDKYENKKLVEECKMIFLTEAKLYCLYPREASGSPDSSF